MPLNKKELKKYHAGQLRIYTVNPTFVRNNYDVGYTLGGHDLVYPEYVPSNEIWLDETMSPQEIEFTLLHELYERYKMSQGLTYEDAHYHFANRIERMARKHGNVKDLIQRELDRQEEMIIEPSHMNGSKHHHKRNHKLHTHLPSESHKLIGIR